MKEYIATLPEDSTKKQKRIVWLDSAKLASIYLVILCHSHAKNMLLISFIGACVIPCFYLLSGLVAKKRKPCVELYHSFCTIMIPYFILYIISYLIQESPFIIKSLLHINKCYSVLTKDVLKSLLGMLIMIDTSYSKMQVGSLWFLPVLFYCRVLYSLVSYFAPCGKKYYIANIVLALLGALLTSPFDSVRTPCLLPVGFREYVFFMLGSFIAPVLLPLMEHYSIKAVMLKLLCGISSVILSVFILKINGSCTVNAFDFGKNIVLCYLCILLGIAGIIALSTVAILPKWTRFFSLNTLIILPFHKALCIPVLKRVLKKALPHFGDKWPPTPYAIILAILALLMCAIPIYLINRYLPIACGKALRKKQNIS